MSELSIIVPLSTFGPDVDLTANGIVATLKDSVKARQEAEDYKSRYNALVSVFGGAGRSLALILSEVEDEYEKAKALRQFATELTNAGFAVREIP